MNFGYPTALDSPFMEQYDYKPGQFLLKLTCVSLFLSITRAFKRTPATGHLREHLPLFPLGKGAMR